MSGFYVKPEFLKKLQPFICGEGVLSTDAPYCKEEPEEIDFKSYYNGKKLAGYIPDWVPGNWTPDAVQFCEEFNKLYVASNQLCIDTPEDVQREIAILIGGGKTKDGKSAAEITYSDVYSLVARQAPGVSSEQFRRMAKQFEAKAKDIYSGLKEIEQLRAQAAPAEEEAEKKVHEELAKLKNVRGSAFDAKANSVSTAITNIALAKARDIPEIEEKKVALMNAIRQVCVDDNPDAIKQLANECGNVIETHKDVKENLAWITGGAGALIASIWAMAKTGRLGKSLRAMKREWDEQTAKGRSWFNPIKIYKSLIAFVRAKEGIEPEKTSVPQEAQPDAAGTGPADAGAPVDEGAQADPAEEAAGADPAVEAAGPAEEAAEKNPIYRMKPGNDVSRLARESDELLHAILELGKTTAGSDPASVKAVESALQMSYASDQEKFQSLVPVLKGDAVLHLIEIAGASLDHSFYDELIPSASSTLTEAAELFKAGRGDEAGAMLSSLKESLAPIDAKHRGFSWALNRLRSIEESAENILIMPEETSSFRKGLITRLRAMNHDVGNNTASIGGIISLMDTPEVFVNFMESSRISFNHSDLKSIINSAVSMNRAEATRREVEINIASSVTKLPVPKSVRKDLYRVLFEAIQNGVKYSDPAKSGKVVYVEVKREKESLVFSIRDNGVGMSEEQAKRIQEEPELRFHPELAPGTGNGVRGTILGLSGKNGWDVTYKPRPGEGTTVIIKVDTSKWSDESGKGGTGTNGAGGSGKLSLDTVDATKPQGDGALKVAHEEDAGYGSKAKGNKGAGGKATRAIDQSTKVFIGTPVLAGQTR